MRRNRGGFCRCCNENSRCATGYQLKLLACALNRTSEHCTKFEGFPLLQDLARVSQSGIGSADNSVIPLHNLCMEKARQCPEVTPDMPEVTPWPFVLYSFPRRDNQHQLKSLPSRLNLQMRPWIFHRLCVRLAIMMYFSSKQFG